MSKAFKLGLGSVAIGCVVFALKYSAFLLTGSVALYADALESIVNIVAALSAAAVLYVSSLPADENHPYGHHKAEYFSAVLEGALIILAAAAILREAYLGLLSPAPIQTPLVGAFINGFATIINAGWAWILIREGRLGLSPALLADGVHLRADVLSSIGVIVGLLATHLTGWRILDPILGAAVAFYIVFSGWQLIRKSVAALMDEAAPPEVVQKLNAAILSASQGALEAHDLRTRYAGRATFIDFHLVVPGDMSVSRAHEICDRIEAALKAQIDGSIITIHVEPHGKAKHHGVLVMDNVELGALSVVRGATKMRRNAALDLRVLVTGPR